MVKIERLEVRFDVEGEGDEAAFARLFEKYMKRWQHLEQEQQANFRRMENARSLGDRPRAGGG